MTTLKPLEWIGSAKADLLALPETVADDVGYLLFRVQEGKRPREAKPLHGFGGASVLELRVDDDGNTYRAVYTVRFAGVVYVLHVFQKKSKRGIATPQADIDLIKARLKEAERRYRAR